METVSSHPQDMTGHHNLTLEPDEVQIVEVSLSASRNEVARLEATLSPDERARAQRLRIDSVRRRFIVGRGTLRHLLGRYLGQDPVAIRFGYSDHGKPSLETHHNVVPLCFNFSNSEERALAAFSLNRELGVDLEYWKQPRDHMDIARRFFSALEYREIAALEPHARKAAFFNCWTRKEAFIKALGDGLRRPLNSFDVWVHAPEAETNLLLATRPDSRQASEWTLYDIDVHADWKAALAVAGTGHTLIRIPTPAGG